MKQILALPLLIFVMASVSCDRNSANPQSSVLGQYELSAFDNSGQLMFTGTISLTSLEQTHLKGQCTIVWEKTAPEGVFDEKGNCEGLIDGKMVSIDSAPFLDDAGLLLEGMFDNGQITGIWMLDGFFTSEPLGKFEAVKKK